MRRLWKRRLAELFQRLGKMYDWLSAGRHPHSRPANLSDTLALASAAIRQLKRFLILVANNQQMSRRLQQLQSIVAAARVA